MVDGEPCTKMTMQGEKHKEKNVILWYGEKHRRRPPASRFFHAIFLCVIWRKTRLLWYGDSSKVYFMWSQGMKKGWKREAEIRFYGHRKKILCDLFIWGPAYEKWLWRWWRRWKKFYIAGALTNQQTLIRSCISIVLNETWKWHCERVSVRGFIIFFSLPTCFLFQEVHFWCICYIVIGFGIYCMKKT